MKFVYILSLFLSISAIASAALERPNILWIVSEDNSKHWLRLYDDTGAAMPNIERLAAQSFVFENAFSNAPVCSVARSTLITGSYAPRVGAQYHRRERSVPMPDGLKMFPYYLRQAGYYTTNNSKKDYNLDEDEIWDQSSGKATYRDRKPGQPFFHVQNFGITHEGRLHFSAEEMATVQNQTSSDSVSIFPYHPDTETFRYTYARYHDNHKTLDQEIGEFLDQLEKDGLSEDTIIFYYGDHGGVLPRGKGYIYESGLNVPLVIHVPEKWRHLAPFKTAGRVEPFVSFVDFGPTVLNLAGVDTPKEMDGQAFLGQNVSAKQLAARDEAFGYADRFDEKYDLVRSFRKGKFKYMRNYQPFNYDGLFNDYRYKMLAYREWRDLYQAGKLNAAQSQFFQPRAAEALYDIEADPHEINNLATQTKYASVLKDLRQDLAQKVKSLPDLSFIPEPAMLAEGLENPVAYGQKNKQRIASLVDTADLSLLSFKKSKGKLKAALNSSDPWKRYWALITCSSFGQEAKPFYDTARKLAANDPENLVRVRAAEFLALAQQADPKSVLIASLKAAKDEVEANLILNTVTLIRDSDLGYTIDIDPNLFPATWTKDAKANVSRRLDYFD